MVVAADAFIIPLPFFSMYRTEYVVTRTLMTRIAFGAAFDFASFAWFSFLFITFKNNLMYSSTFPPAVTVVICMRFGGRCFAC